MGNLYRFVEPVLLLLLKQKGRSYGYELSSELKRYAFTNAEIEIAALYKTLRTLEENSCVTSEWVANGSGPAKRVYALTRRGEEHLDEWVAVLTHISGSMRRFLTAAKREKKPGALAAAPGRR
jgi:PadR family transcriptional regulator, regulatory protein PadR